MTLPLALHDLTIRLAINLVAVVLLVRGVYYRQYQRTDLFLTFFGLNLVVFLIALFLGKAELTMGAAFGLFAVFSMLRYRTEGISAKDMTYLFVVIALGLLLAVAPGEPLLLAIIAGTVVAVSAGLEWGWLAPREHSQIVWYDNMELIRPDARAALLEDLRTRTGLPVHHVQFEEVDLVKDTVRMTVYYRQP